MKQQPLKTGGQKHTQMNKKSSTVIDSTKRIHFSISLIHRNISFEENRYTCCQVWWYRSSVAELRRTIGGQFPEAPESPTMEQFRSEGQMKQMPKCCRAILSTEGQGGSRFLLKIRSSISGSTLLLNWTQFSNSFAGTKTVGPMQITLDTADTDDTLFQCSAKNYIGHIGL